MFMSRCLGPLKHSHFLSDFQEDHIQNMFQRVLGDTNQ